MFFCLRIEKPMDNKVCDAFPFGFVQRCLTLLFIVFEFAIISYKFNQCLGCLLRSFPADVIFDNTTGVSFTCDLSDNIAAPWPSSSSISSMSFCAPGKLISRNIIRWLESQFPQNYYIFWCDILSLTYAFCRDVFACTARATNFWQFRYAFLANAHLFITCVVWIM